MQVSLKVITSFLLVSLIFSPVAPVFAQEAEVPTETPVTETETTTSTETLADTPTTEPSSTPDLSEVSGSSPASEDTPSSEELVTPSDEEAEVLPSDEGDPEPESLLSGGEAESNQYPQSFSYQSTAPKVDQETGALTQRVVLEIPPGRNGLHPDIALEYNSQRTEDGIVGYGWTVSIPSIERLNKTGTDRYYIDNYFTSSFGGELATTSTTTPGEYRHKVEDGSFIKYSFSTSTNIWTAYDKKGTKYTFGSTDQARQFATTSSSRVHKWMLEEIRDTNDNFVRFEYEKDNHQIYPYRIYYTGYNSTDGIFRIDFTRDTRPDIHTSFKSGFRVVTRQRITEIKALVDGQWVRKYTLGYTSGANGNRSILSSVQETGRDSVGTELVLPAITFEYASSTSLFVKRGSDLTGGDNISSIAYVVSDTNGDGLNDLNMSYADVFDSNHANAWIQKNIAGLTLTGQNFNYPSSPFPVTWANNSSASIYYPTTASLRHFDVDGDGRPDIFESNRDSGGATTTTFYKNNYVSTTTTYAWLQASTTGDVPVFQFVPNGDTYSLNAGLFGNINGDNILDFAAYIAGKYGPVTHLGNGSASWKATTTIFAAVKSMPDKYGEPASNSQLVDINGDGLEDWVYSDDTKTYVRLNTGTAWESTDAEGWTIATSTYYHQTSPYSTYWDRGARFLDVNGDGLMDFVRAYQILAYSGVGDGSAAIPAEQVKVVLLNTGSGWATSTSHASQFDYITFRQNQSQIWVNTDIRYNEYVNWNGNGQQKQDVLQKINYPKGGNTQVTYSLSAQLGTNRELPFSYLVVTRITNNDGTGIAETNDYTYHDGRLYTAQGPYERKFGGFEIITETQAETIIKSYYHQGNAASTTVGEQNDGYAQAGRIYKKEVIDRDTNTLLKRTFYKYNTVDQGNGRIFISRVQELVQDFSNTDVTHKDKATEYTYATSTGDLMRVVERGEVIGSSDGTYTDTGSDSRTKVMAYVASSTVNMSLPIREMLANNASTTIKDIKYSYDNLTFGSVGKGNQTKREDWISASTYASTTKTYNTYGLVTVSKDPHNNQTSYSYDTYNLYPTTVTNALSQATTYTYDYATGRVKVTTDPNTRQREHVYDPVGRLTEEKIPDLSNPATLVTKTRTTYTDNVFPTKQATDLYRTATATSSLITYFDGLGRAIQERSSAEGDNTYNVKNRLYGSHGLIERDSLPFFASSTGWTAGTTTTGTLLTSFYYDGLQRTTAVANAVGTTSYTYGAWEVSKTDSNGNVNTYAYDAYGNLTSVTESAISSLIWGSEPVSYWKLDEASGVRDDTAANNDLTDNNTVGSETGKINNAGTFVSASSEYLSISDGSQSGLDLNNSMSVSAWVKFSSTPSSGNYMYIVSKKRDGGNQGGAYALSLRNDGGTLQLYLELRGTDWIDVVKNWTPTTGVWYHIAGTWDGSNSIGKIYVNGSQVGGDTVSSYTGIQTNDVSFKIGANESLVGSPQQFMNGSIDEVGIWSRVLTANEVRGLYNAGAGLAYGDTPSGSGGVTDYEYDAANNLTKITDAADNIRNFTYDGLGRRLTAEDLHAPADGTYGTWTYTYDVAGNMTQKVDPKSQTIQYTYDALNRVLTENYTGQSGTEITYTYDNCADGKGRVCTASTTDSLLGYAYNANGSIKTATSTILGTSTLFSFAYSYDRQGNQTQITYPDSGRVAYNYNIAGLVESVERRENGDTSTSTVVSNFDYSPTNQPTRINYANGVVSTSTYNAAALYRLSNKVTTLPTASRVQDMTYTYDALGNITQIVDASNSGTAKTISYTYDDLSRLISASTTNATTSPNYSYTYAYNAIGNITSGPLGTYTYAGTGYTNPHAVTNIGSGGGGGGTSTTTTHTIYADSTAWNNWSWDTTTDFNEAGTVYAGTKSIKATYTAAWGGLYLEKNPGVSVSTSTAIQFAIRSSTASPTVEIDAYGANDVQIGLADLDDYIPSFAANTWYLVTIPLADLGATSTLTGFSALRSTTGILYFDEIKLIATSTSGGSGTNLSYDNNGNLTSDGTWTHTWDYRNRLTQSVSGSVTSTYAYDHENNRVKLVEGSSTTFFPSKLYNVMAGGIGTTTKYIYANGLLLSTIERGATTSTSGGSTSTTTTHTLFSDSLTTGWNNWSWASAVDFNEAGTVYSGTKSIEVTYGAAWEGLYLQKSAGVTTSTSTALQFAIRSTTGSADYEIDAYGPSDTLIATVDLDTYTGGSNIAANTWYLVTIPLSHLNATSTNLTGFVVMRSAAGTAFIDEVKLIATSTGGGSTSATTTVRYIHGDHLGSTNIVTDASGQTILETLDYYPYGETRLDSKAAGYTGEKRKFAELLNDTSTGLNYAQNRYQNPSRGHFISQDPVHLALGDQAQMKHLTGQGLQRYLMDPQLLNSYSYARGNPITMKDPTGNEPITIGTVTGISLILGFASLVSYGVQLQIDKFNLEMMKSYPTVYSQEQIKAAEQEMEQKAATQAVSTALGWFSAPLSIALDTLGLIGDFANAVNKAGILKGPTDQVQKGHSSGLPGLYINSSQSTPKTTGGQVTTGVNNGNSTAGQSSPGLLPRSANPVGYDQKSGAPVYCWGQCGN